MIAETSPGKFFLQTEGDKYFFEFYLHKEMIKFL